MGKKGKGAKGPTEAQPTEAESLLLLRIQLLEEKLSKAQLASDEAVIVRSEVNGKMTTEAQSHRDHVEYLNLQRENKEAELKALTDKYAQLVHEKEMSEKRLGKELGDMKAALDACEHKLAESDANVSRLNDQVVEIGTLRANATSDTGTLADLREELEMTKHQLFESQQHLQVLAMADDRIVGDDGTHALPLLLVEAIRLNLKKPVLIEQAMTAMQYVLSGERHADAELIRRRGGIDHVLEAMTLHPEVSELQSSACGLLWKLGYADPPSRASVVKANGMAIIMAAMQRHTGHPRLHYNACGALRHLLVNEARAFSKESQIAAGQRPEPLPPIDPRRGGRGGKRGLRGMPHDPRTLPMAIPPLHPSNSHPRLTGGPARPGGHRSNPALTVPPGGGQRVITPGVGRPATVATYPSRRGAMDEVEVQLTTKEHVSTQAMRLVLASMDAHVEAPLVQEYGCGTLYNISLADPAHRSQIAAEGGVGIVLRAMREHSMETGVQINACALLKELADVQQALPLIEEGGGRDLLELALQNHQYNDELLGRATEALRYLPEAVKLPDDV